MQKKRYLEGLDTLRFIAAALVLIAHARYHLNVMDISYLQNACIFAQSGKAVNFFFTLSGFLLCYLALFEIGRHGKMNFRAFYLRRVLRILPLYYLVLFTSMIVHVFVIPHFTGESLLGFPPLQGMLMCIFMLPNVVIKIWPDTVGSINILWSIGVEEQFYLFFPLIIGLIIRAKNKIRTALLLYLAYYTFYWWVCLGYSPLPRVYAGWVSTCRFHFMLMGILLALLLHPSTRPSEHFERLLNNFWFQIALLIAGLVAIFDPIPLNKLLRSVYSATFFALMIATVAFSTKKRWFNFEIQPFAYFGKLSYGIYLLHPLVSYGLRFVIEKNDFLHTVIQQFPILYILLLLAITIWIAHLSYQYYEVRFLKLKERRETREMRRET